MFTEREIEAQRGQGTCLGSLSEMRANESKKQPSLVEEHCTWSSEHGSAASMLCGLEEVTGTLWSASVKWEENESVSLLTGASIRPEPRHTALLLDGRCVWFNSRSQYKVESEYDLGCAVSSWPQALPLPHTHCAFHTHSFPKEFEQSQEELPIQTVPRHPHS